MENFKHEQLYTAMRDAVDMFEGLVVQAFLIGETARHAWDGTDLDVKEITFAIKESEYTDVTKSLMKSLRSSMLIEPNEARYLVNDVPVIIKVIKRKYEFLKYLDRKQYNYDTYLFPNPFEKYYKARFIVQ
mgnify:CR=1 FL=1